MTVGTATSDVLVPTGDLAQVSARITQALQAAKIQVVLPDRPFCMSPGEVARSGLTSSAG